MGYYNTAQICTNGHIITDSYDINPEFRQNFCDICGAKTIITCPNCNSKIRGDYEVENITFIDSTMSSAPSYCYNCGKPYPWTDSALKAARELLAIDDTLSQDELDYFTENMTSITVDTPNTKVVSTKLKIYLNKAGSAIVSAFKDIVVEIGSETAKKIILGE